jgi:plasmid maintenance system antidote protein VapI
MASCMRKGMMKMHNPPHSGEIIREQCLEPGEVIGNRFFRVW